MFICIWPRTSDEAEALWSQFVPYSAIFTRLVPTINTLEFFRLKLYWMTLVIVPWYSRMSTMLDNSKWSIFVDVLWLLVNNPTAFSVGGSHRSADELGLPQKPWTLQKTQWGRNVYVCLVMFNINKCSPRTLELEKEVSKNKTGWIFRISKWREKRLKKLQQRGQFGTVLPDVLPAWDDVPLS